MEYIDSTFARKETGQCHNCKHNIGGCKVAELWYKQGKLPVPESTVINVEIKCTSRDRCATYDDLDNLTRFDNQGYVWVHPIEWVDDSASCEFWSK